MKIAVLEFETHPHLLLLWHELLNSLPFEYHFFVSEAIYNQIPEIPDSLKTIENPSKGITTLEQHIKPYDLIIFNTLHRNFEKFHSVFSHKKTFILVHNVNFYFHSQKPDWSYLFKIQDKKLIYYYLKLIFKEKIYKTKHIITQATGYGFLNQTLSGKNQIPQKQNFVFPLFYNKYITDVENTEELKIVIPGIVSQNRRDYSLIFEILESLQPKEKLKFIFLGKSEDPKINLIFRKLQKSLNPNIQIEYFTQRISQKDFDISMNSAHFVLSPLHKETQFYLQKELYGQSKVSGNEADCIIYGKIGIFPDYYSINDWITLSYKNKNSLQDLLENLTFEEYKKHHQKLNTQITNFSKENILNELKTILNSMIHS